MENDRISRLHEKAKQLEDRTGFVTHIAGNISNMHRFSDSGLRQYLNNERLNLGGEFMDFLDGKPGFGAIDVFAKQGDPLCQAIKEYAKQHNFNSYPLIFYHIAQKLLARMMTKQEYLGYLSGRKPISTYQGEHYLSKKDQTMTF